MNAKSLALIAAASIAMVGCTSSASTDTAAAENAAAEAVSLRNLADTNIAAPAEAGYRLQGDLVATPSDPKSRFYLLRVRQAVGGNVVAILRQEHGDRIAYARAEADCGKRLFHVLGVGPTRGQAEATLAHDGPLRPIAGLPLRQELAGAVCAKNGTPLAAAS